MSAARTETRQLAVCAARLVLRRMRPGQGTTFTLPQAEPERRDAYRMIASAAHRLWGAGSYRVGSGPDGMWLIRKQAGGATRAEAERMARDAIKERT